MHVAFGINAIGLGHATRSVPLIEALLKAKHKVTIISSKRPLKFCKQEFGSRVQYVELEDYSFQKNAYTGGKVSVTQFILNLPRYHKEILNEHNAFLRIHKRKKFDAVFSDSRFGLYSKNVPSFFIYHHVRMGDHLFFGMGKILSEFFTTLSARHFDKMLIPDYEKNGLSGELAHGFQILSAHEYQYIGPFSMAERLKVKEDIDYFFSISGPEPLRTHMEKKVLSQLPKLKDKKVVVTLGNTDVKGSKTVHGAKVYGYLGRKKQNEMLNRSKVIITRSGYTTVMDVAKLGKKALMIPTKGQPEQEYLAKYFAEKKYWPTVALEKLKIPEDLYRAEKMSGYPKRKQPDADKLIASLLP